jgi:dipeptide transport system ATP-binding protein
VAYVFISHNLAVVRHIADEVMVMYLGKVVEQGAKEMLFSAPAHPYTRALLASTPMLEAKSRQTRIVLQGELPSPLDPPSGCGFHKRCPHAIAECAQHVPELRAFNDRQIACHRAEELG